MSRKANIFELKESMTQKELVAKSNANFKSLSRITDKNSTTSGEVTPTNHNELNRRDVDDCHPLKAITNLTEMLDDRPNWDQVYWIGRVIETTRTSLPTFLTQDMTWRKIDEEQISSTITVRKFERTA